MLNPMDEAWEATQVHISVKVDEQKLLTILVYTQMLKYKS